MRKLFPFLLLLLAALESARAEVSFFDRYFRDQPRRRLAIPAFPRLQRNPEGRIPLTERQAIELALNYNLDVNVQRYRLLEEDWRAEQLRGVYDPVYSFGLNWDRQTTPAASVLQGGNRVTDILTSLGTGYRQSFSSGSSLEVRFNGIRNRTTSFFASLVPAINTNLEVLFRQNLLRGFGRRETEYEIEISRRNLDISREEFRRRVNELIFQVRERYWELQYALQDIEVKKYSLRLAEVVLEQNQARFEVGTAARLEVVQAEAEVASRREELIRSQYEYRRVQDQLVRLISNLEDPRSLGGELVPTDAVFEPEPVREGFERLLEQAAELRPELQQAELQLESERLRLQLSRDRLRPSLELVAGYQQFGLGGTQVIRDFSSGFVSAPIIAVIPGGLGDSLEQLFSGDFYGYVLGLNLQLPIFNREARAANAQSQLALDRADLQRQSVAQLVAAEIRDALTRIEMNQARLQAAQATVRFAEERLAGEEARFEVGMGTTRDLIEAQRDLVQARSVLLRARVDLILSHALLDRVLGRGLERHGIRLAEVVEANVRE